MFGAMVSVGYVAEEMYVICSSPIILFLFHHIVKLFDFGLATVMPPNGDPYDEKFEMSGAGSPRYMAPEVLVDPPEPYNMKADVYTFGIVLWEMFALEVPYKDIKSRGRLMDFVGK